MEESIHPSSATPRLLGAAEEGAAAAQGEEVQRLNAELERIAGQRDSLMERLDELERELEAARAEGWVWGGQGRGRGPWVWEWAVGWLMVRL
jgi:DNA-binding IclR family transcriptional regulator